MDSFEEHRDDAYWAYTDGRLLDPQQFSALMPTHPFDDLWDASVAWGQGPTNMETALRAWAEQNRSGVLEASWGLWNTASCVGEGTDLDRLGSDGLLEATFDGDGETNLRIRSGYDALLERAASPLDVRLRTPVTKIEWNTHGATVHTGSGALACNFVLITVPLGVLKVDVIEFRPPLPGHKRRAIENLGAGCVDKVVLVFDRPFWPAEMGGLFTDLDTQSWIVPGWGRTEHSPVLRALMGGRAAERLGSSADPVSKAVQDLEAVFQVGLTGRLREARFISWSTDPWSRTSYSFVPPGGAGLRAVLSEPVEDVLFFAGEATSVLRPGTVHGAIESGERAAAELTEPR